MKKHFSLDNFPEAWNIFSVEDLLKKFQNGYAFSSSGYLNESRDIVPIITMTNISIEGSFNFDYQKAKKWNAKDTDKLKRYLVEDGDLIIAMTDVTPSMELIGRGAFVSTSQPLLLNQRVGLLKTIDDVDNKFLSYFFNSDYWRKYSKVSASLGAQANISTKDILKGNIPLPPLPEQKKIAEILSGIDHLIQIKTNQIEKLNDLKKATINKLLLTSKQTSVPLKKIAKCQGGFAFKSLDSQTKGTKWLKIANVSMGIINWEDQSFLPNNFQEEYSDFVLSKGDIVMAMTRPVIKNQLKVAKILKSDEGSLLNQRVGRIIPKPMIVPEYLFFVLQFDGFVRQIQAAIAGSDPPNVSSAQIESLLVPLPKIKEQIQIASIIASIQSLIDQKSQSLKKSQLLKESISQDLLSGGKRVNV